jgi:hypothetical protein
MKNSLVAAILAVTLSGTAIADDDVDRLVGAMLGDTPILSDLQELTDQIGGRVTGSASNMAAVDWALGKFEEADVPATREPFEMRLLWQELAVTAEIGEDVRFAANAVAKPFSTGVNDVTAALVDGGLGTPEDFARLGDDAKNAWVLVATPLLDDIVGLGGLFAEYGNGTVAEAQAFESGAAGIVFMSSRPGKLLYRLPQFSAKNRQPILLMARESAKRAQRLIRNGKSLTLTATIKVDTGYAHQPANVIGEIRGSRNPQEIILIGAHLDSHDLGTGALDNASNAMMMIDIARQMTRLGLKPARTIRFALWNGEEQGLVGSWRYTQQHQDELDQHVMAASFDIGTGRILGFFTGGMDGLGEMVDKHLQPVAGLGPYQQVNIPLVGTDNFDFMMQGIPNLIAMQADANYASNYHAASDTFDKVDQHQLKLNSAIVAALVWGFANSDDRLPRHSRAQIEKLVNTTDLEQQMRNFGVWEGWASGDRGRQR